jgi:hypothetical protein
MSERTIINRHDHGGARIYVERGDHRDLVVDIYEPEARREHIIAALIGAGIIAPPDPEP